MNFDLKKSNSDNAESQLNQKTSDFYENSADIPTQILWDQIESNDKFTSQILKTLHSRVYYYNKIPLTECEKHQNSLYFFKRKYISNLNYFYF